MKKEQYKICQIRGHEAISYVTTGNETWSICKYCEIHYRYTEPVLKESIDI